MGFFAGSTVVLVLCPRFLFCFYFAAEPPLPLVLFQPMRHGLPLHVVALVRPAGTKGPHMVNDVARTGSAALTGARAGVGSLEGENLCLGLDSRSASALALDSSNETAHTVIKLRGCFIALHRLSVSASVLFQ